MTLESSVQAFRLRVRARAQALGNVSQTCREFGISRPLVYRGRHRSLAYGPDGLYPKRVGPRRGRPPTLSWEAERANLSLALAWPTWGPARVSVQRAQPEHGGWPLSPQHHRPVPPPGWTGHPPGAPECSGSPQRPVKRLAA